LRVESFAWIAERKDVLCAFFFLAAVALYLRYKGRPSRWLYAAWLSCGLLALMSKPTAVSLPIILFMLDFWPVRRQASLWRLVAEKLPLVAGDLAITYLAVVGQSQAMALTPVGSLPVRLENAAVSCVRYLGKMLWPVDLGCFYPFNAGLAFRWGIPAIVLLVAVTAIAIVQWKRRAWLLAGWSWFLIALLPNSGLVQAGRQALADRFTELPMIGIVILLVWAVSEWAGSEQWRRKTAIAGAGVVLVALGILTIRQIGYWKDSETLFVRTIAVEDSAYIRDNLATSLIQQERLGEAETHLLAAVRLARDEYPHHNNLAVLYGKMRRPQEALEQARIASTLAPDNYSVAETLALANLAFKNYPAALQSFDRAVQLGSDPTTLAPLLNDTGVELAKNGQGREAEALFRKAIAYDPLYVDAHYNLVHDLAAMGNQEEAKAALKAAIASTGPKPEYQDFMGPGGPPLTSAPQSRR
jgi:Tfp pilus assembly protein PilF